ncbi:MAG: hypothetical protein WKG00_14710 [Polyangiaceae bacterium]
MEEDPLRLAGAAGLEGAHMRPTRRLDVPCAEGTFGGRVMWLTHLECDQGRVPAVVAPLRPTLDLGLEVRSSAFTSATGPSTIGHAHLDQEYIFGADDRVRARALFDEALAARVYQLHCACWSVHITDQQVTITGDTDPGGWSEGGLRAACDVAALIDAARERIPLAEAVAPHLEAWMQLAGRFGAELTRTPLRVAGSVETLHLECHAPRLGHRQHRLELSLRREQPLAAGLQVSPTRAVVDRLGVLLGGQDVEVGDAAFDAAFRVRVDGVHEEAVRRAFDFGTRALVLGARDSGATIEIDDVGVRATFDAAAPPGALPAAIEPLAEAAQRIERALHRGPQRSAYRG